MSEAFEAGALAFRLGHAYEGNPHVPGGPEVAQYCRLNDWPEEARQWHRGWSGACRQAADAARTKEVVS